MQLSVYLLRERFALLCGAHKLLMCPLNPLSILLVPWSWAFSFCDLFTSIWFQSHPSAFLTASWGRIVRVDSRTKLAHTYIPRVWDVWSTKQGGHDVPFKEEQKLTGNSPCLASWNGMHHLSHLLSHSFVMNFLRAIVTRSYHASHYSFRVALCIETSKKIPIWLLSSSVPNKTTTKNQLVKKFQAVIPSHPVTKFTLSIIDSLLSLWQPCFTQLNVYRNLRVRKPHADSLILCIRPQSLLVKRFQAFVSFAPSDKVYYSLHFCLSITIKEIVPNEPTLVINPLLNLPEIWSVLLWDYNEQLFIGGCNPVCTNTALVSQKWVHLFWPNLLAYLQFVITYTTQTKNQNIPFKKKTLLYCGY